MAISKRDLETAALNWKVRAENAETRVEELQHALNLLVNGSVEWFAHHRTEDGAQHDFGIAIAFDVPINHAIARMVKGADVEQLPLIFWQTNWPQGHKFISVNTPSDFLSLKGVMLQEKENVQPRKDLAELIERVADEWEDARRQYLAKRGNPVIH